MATTTIFGLPSSFFVYTITSASLVEAAIFITLYVGIINDISAYRDTIVKPSNYWNLEESISIAISIICISFNIMRSTFAIVALIGQYVETIKTLEVFLGFTFIGLLVNIFMGAMGMQFYWTFSVGIGTMAVSGLHIAYLVIGEYICRMENQKRSADRPRLPVVPGPVPDVIPVQPTILLTAPSPQVVFVQQQSNNTGMILAPNVFYEHTPPPHRSYDDSVSSGASSAASHLSARVQN